MKLSKFKILPLQKNERWIEGYENRYSISTNGEVRTHLRKETVKYARDDKEGYQILDLYTQKTMFGENNAKTLRLHRLVAQTFIPNPNNYPVINHKDGNKRNNSVENLEWCTQAYNNQHAKKTGLNNNYGDGHYKRRQYARG